MTATRYYIPRRKMSIAPYSTDPNAPIVWTPAGEIQEAEATFPITSNIYEAPELSGDTCRTIVDFRNNVANAASLIAQMMHADFSVLRVALSGVVSEPGVAPITDEDLGSQTQGQEFRLAQLPDHTVGVTITDSDASPVTLVLGTHFVWIAKHAGKGEMLDVSGLTPPFKASYTPIASELLKPLESINSFWHIALDGANEGDACKAEREIFYRASVSEATVRRMHEPATVQTPVPQPVTFALDRDEARNSEFGAFEQLKAA